METRTTARDGEQSIRQAFLMAAEGIPVRKIVGELNSRGLLGHRDRAWTVATLWRHLNDPVYAGRRNAGGKRAFQLDEPVVSEALYSATQERLKGKGRKKLLVIRPSR